MTRKYANEKETKSLFRKSKSSHLSGCQEVSKDPNTSARSKIKNTVYIEDSDEKYKPIATTKQKSKKRHQSKPVSITSGFRNLIRSSNYKDLSRASPRYQSRHDTVNYMGKTSGNSPKAINVDKRGKYVKVKKGKMTSQFRNNDQLRYAYLKKNCQNHATNPAESHKSQHKKHKNIPESNFAHASKEHKVRSRSGPSQNIGPIKMEEIPSGFFNSASDSSPVLIPEKRIQKRPRKLDEGYSSGSLTRSRSTGKDSNYQCQLRSPPVRGKLPNMKKIPGDYSMSSPSHNHQRIRKQPTQVNTESNYQINHHNATFGSQTENDSESESEASAYPQPLPRSRMKERTSGQQCKLKGDVDFYDVAEIKHLLHKEKIRSENILDDKRQLEKEFATLRLQYENVYSKYMSLKLENEQLLMQDVERKNLHLTKQKLQLKVRKLQEVIDKNEAVELEKDRKLMELEKERCKLIHQTTALKLEKEHLSKQVVENDNEEMKMTQLKKHEHEKDLKIRVMHNELVELKGKIRVLARFKPDKDRSMFKFIAQDGVQLTQHQSDIMKKPSKLYNFSHIFRPTASQEEVYEEVSPYVTSCIDGYNVCVITYGQTGSGKTYTMKGNQESPGIITRAMSQVFHECNQRTVWKYRLYVSILQIYNENMTDLLTDTVNRVYIQDDGNTVFIKGLREFRVKTQEDIVHYIVLGRKRRATTKTVLNFDSSRSHFIVMLRIHGTSLVHDQSTQGILTLCDLAGFERLSGKHTTENIALEAKYISKSLTVLARVFEALRKHHKSVPFRESKLTHILKPSLSGEAKCVLILTLSMILANVESTLRTLDFGSNAMKTSLGVAKQNIGARKNFADGISPTKTMNALAASTPSEYSDLEVSR